MTDDDWKKVAEKNLGKHLEYINGICAERERIIALLEAEHNCPPYSCAIHAIIALIKGENE